MISKKSILSAFEEITNDMKVSSVVVFCYHRGGETECVRVRRPERPSADNSWTSEYLVSMGALKPAEKSFTTRYKGRPKPMIWIQEYQ